MSSEADATAAPCAPLTPRALPALPARVAPSGLLGRQVQQVQNGVPEGMMGIDGAFALVQNPLPGNPYLYLASWTWSQENPAASSGKGFDSSVTVLKRDAETGHVTFVECLHDGPRAAGGRRLVAVVGTWDCNRSAQRDEGAKCGALAYRPCV